MKVIAATHNGNKLREFREILKPQGFEIITEEEAGISLEPEETGSTFEENSRIKAAAIYAETGLATIADDSGLCIDALGGEPGVYSARYGGLENNADRIKLVLEKMNDIPDGLRTARFICSIVFIAADGTEITASGSVEGEITHEPHGESGFGYDPIFFSPELGKTFAEAEPSEKNSVSHRARALAEFRKKLEKSK